MNKVVNPIIYHIITPIIQQAPRPTPRPHKKILTTQNLMYKMDQNPIKIVRTLADISNQILRLMGRPVGICRYSTAQIR